MADEFNSFNDLIGLGVPHHIAGRHEHLWADESSYTQAGRQAGPAIPGADNKGSLALYTRGDHAEDSELGLQVQNSGLPGIQALGLLRQEALDVENTSASPSWPASPWYGQDVPTADSDHRLLVEATDGGGAETRARDNLTLPDGSVLHCYEQETGSRWETKVIRVEGEDDSVGVPVSVDLGSVDDGERLPCLCLIPEGILCFLWIKDTVADAWQIRAFFSEDGSSWSLYQRACLRAAVPASGTEGYTPRRRLRARYLHGQILLVAGLRAFTARSASRDVIGQWASPDVGATFQQITIWSGEEQLQTGTMPDLVVVGGLYLFGCLSLGLDDGNPTGVTQAHRKRLGSAYTPIQFSEEDGFELTYTAEFNTGLFSDDDFALCVDEAGVVYATARKAQENAPQSLGQYPVFRSDDFGRSWKGLGTSSAGSNPTVNWWRADTLDVSPSRVAWTYAKGRIVILHNVKTPADVGSSLFLTYLGGQSTRTLPGYELHPTDRRVGWDYTYRPYARAENMNPARYTQGGTGTINLQANAAGTRQVARLSSPTGQRAYWEFSPSTGGEEKLLLYAAFEVVSGPVSPSNEQGFEVRLAGSSTDHHIGVYLGTTGFELHDLNAVSPLVGAVDVGADLEGGIAFLVSMETNDAVVFYRLLSADPTYNRRWILGPSSSGLTSSSPATTNRVRFGAPNVASADRITNVLAFHDSPGSYAGRGLDNTGSTEDLSPIPMSSEIALSDSGTGMCFLGSNVWARGVGRGVRGDGYTVKPFYRYGVERADVYRCPNPRRPWRTAGRGPQTLAWALDGEDPAPFQDYPGTGITFLLLHGINYQGASLQYTTSLTDPVSWEDLLVVNAGAELSFPFTRIGSCIVPAPSAVSTRYVARNELAGQVGAGAFVLLDDGQGTVVARRVVKNERGLTTGTNAGTQKQLAIWLDGVDNAGDPGGGTATVVMPSVLGWAYHVGMPNYRALRLIIPGGQDGPENYLETGALMVGHILPFGARPAAGGRLAYTHNTASRETRNRGVQTRYRSAGRRERFVPWVDQMSNRFGLTGDAPEPAYFKGSQTPGAQAVGNLFDTAELLAGLMEELGGPDRVVVYVEKLPLGADGAGGGSNTGYTSRPSRYIYGRAFLEEDLEREFVAHNPDDADQHDMRIRGITIVEETGRSRRGY